jgi:arylformamidase
MFVYKNYDQLQLDRQYNNRAQVPEYAVHLDRWEAMSQEASKIHHAVRDIAYGGQPRQTLDIYPSATSKSKTLVFIHGGYWHKLDKSMFQFIGGSFQSYDITTVLINYPLAPASTIGGIVDSCKKAVQWVHENIASYNGDPEKIYVAGHSAGGHLAVMMMTENDHNMPGIVKGVFSLSGLFNLQPIRLSDINLILNLDDQAVLANSPAKLNPACACPLLIVVGEDESDEFREQSKELYNGWKKMNSDTRFLELNGVNHYSIVEILADKKSTLHKTILKIIGA